MTRWGTMIGAALLLCAGTSGAAFVAESSDVQQAWQCTGPCDCEHFAGQTVSAVFRATGVRRRSGWTASVCIQTDGRLVGRIYDRTGRARCEIDGELDQEQGCIDFIGAYCGPNADSVYRTGLCPRGGR